MELWNEDLRARMDLARSELLATQSTAEQICLNADQARREADRLRPLRRDRLISEEQLDAAETTARSRQAGCNSGRAQVGVARARLAVANAELDRTILRAPFAGVVAELTGEIGEYVTPSPPGIPTPPAVDLIDYSCVLVSAPMDEVDAPSVRVGLAVRVTLDAFRDRVFAGQVHRVAPYVVDLEKQARTVEVEVELDDPALADVLLPGYSADIEVILEAREAALRIPTEAVLEGNRALLLEDGVLTERNLRVGLANWRWTEIEEGVAKGEQVVVSVDRPGVVAGADAVVEGAP
jgi:HlyD family secretion protein